MKKILLFLITLSLLTGCNKSYEYHGSILFKETTIIEEQEVIENNFDDIENYSIDSPNIILDPYGNSPLSALIMFVTEKPEEITIKIMGKDEYTTLTHTFSANDKHYLPIYGLYADTLNVVEISTNDKTYEYHIQTEKLPSDIPNAQVINNIEYAHNDLYMAASTNASYQVGYDFNGDIRFYMSYENAASWGFYELNNGHYLIGTDRLYHTPYYNTGLLEIDLLGKVYKEINVEDGYHHGVYQLENNNLLVMNNNFDNNTVEDYIVEIDYETGDIVKRIDLANLIPMDDGKANMWQDFDWFHNNSIWYEEDTNSIILSGRHQDIVAVIDYNSGELKYLIGDPTGWDESMQQYFLKADDSVAWQYAQHSAITLENNNYFIFDNGNNRSKDSENYLSAEENYSRGVIYQVDEENMSIKQVSEFGQNLGSDFYSSYVSNVQEIADNHYFINSGGILYLDGKIQNDPAVLTENPELLSHGIEVLNDEVIFELKIETNNYRVERLSIYNDNTVFSLGNDGIIGEFKSTVIKEVVIDDSYVDDAVMYNDQFDIEVELEQDRLRVEGTYNKVDAVDLILFTGSTYEVYAIPVTQNDYNAMCAFIPGATVSDDELRIARYVNEDEFKTATYQIYLRVNGIIYDLDTYFSFK